MVATLALTLTTAAGAESGAGREAPAAGSEGRAPGEAALLGKLVAPCCWTQTLDVHSGATPDALRAEIHRRLSSGESAAAIEADFVARYGPRVLAEPEGSPLPLVTLGLVALALGAAGGLVLALRRWVRRSEAAERASTSDGSGASPEGAGGAGARDVWDERLDDELRAMGG